MEQSGTDQHQRRVLVRETACSSELVEIGVEIHFSFQMKTTEFRVGRGSLPHLCLKKAEKNIVAPTPMNPAVLSTALSCTSTNQNGRWRTQRNFWVDFGVRSWDGYQSYHRLPKSIRSVDCLAHARRKFDKARTAVSKEQRSASRPAEALFYFTKLFQLE